jgi:hypothetical protein
LFAAAEELRLRKRKRSMIGAGALILLPILFFVFAERPLPTPMSFSPRNWLSKKICLMEARPHLAEILTAHAQSSASN